ncbi:MAG: D-glycerate dehydrogenase [Patescibacteria group bacterium]
MKKIYITRQIPELGIKMLTDKGYEVDVNTKDRPLTKKELIKALSKKTYDGVLTLLTDQIDGEVMDACPTAKIYANFAIGFNNFNLEEAKKRNIILTNTPGGGADRVAEHAWALILALSCRVAEGDRYMRDGKYKGWDPMLLHGTKLAGKTLGILGSGRIGADVAHRGKFGFNMNVAYYDVKRNEAIEKEFGAVFYPTVEEVLKVSDVVSIHVPLLDSTKHLMNEERLKMMKRDAYLINTSRGPVIDEKALVEALKVGTIRGAGLDVFEFEPELVKGLSKLENVVLTPHIASATEESRHDMTVLSVENIISTLETGTPKTPVV